MDFIIRLVGIIVIVTGGTTPDISVDTALAPKASQSSYCLNSGFPEVTVEPHHAYVRVSDTQIADSSGWPSATPCDPPEKCSLFEIPAGSEITINPNFTPPGVPSRGVTFCQVRPLSAAMSGVKLVSKPRDKAHFAFELPPGILEAVRLGPPGNPTALATYQWVRAPLGSRPKEIEVHATPFTGGTPLTLKLHPGAMINLLYMPEHDAKGDLNTPHPTLPPERRHFYLVNELLSQAQQICRQPPPVPRPLIVLPDGTMRCVGPTGDPFCSNTGCC
jgi:hypothetical protein